MKVVCLLLFSFLCIGIANSSLSKIYALVPVHYDDYTGKIPVFDSNKHVNLYVFGEYLTSELNVGISKQESCAYVEPAQLTVKPDSKGHIGLVSFTAPSTSGLFTKVRFHICIMKPAEGKWLSQGKDERTTFYVYQKLLTPWVSVIIIVICFTLSSLMSGLNLGLMSLDQNQLLLLKNAGTKKEKKYAKKIIPIRRNGNFLLCTIVITGTLCNAISTVSIDNFVSDGITVVISTIIIVLFCEILPQSVCSYYPLEVGAYTSYITMTAMVITGPISYSLSKVFNCILGKEMAAKYTKARLKELLKFTALPTNEEKIISGTLDLNQKMVGDVMTPLEDVFKLPITAVMDFETIALILGSGYSRIPVYVENESNICYVLLTKDLALIDPDDNVPVKALVQTSKNVCKYISTETTLDRVLVMFKESRSHIAFVIDSRFPTKANEKRVVGLVTFEDVIEEIFQAEINDETDILTDNRIKTTISDESRGLLSFLAKHSKKTVTPPEPLKLATYHFLSGLEIFSAKRISSKVLLNLLGLDVFYTTLGHKTQSSLELYVHGVPADYFIMIIEGHMEVKFGPEELKFEAGPFRYFGIEALSQGSAKNKNSLNFIPDYTLRAVKKTMYLKISKVLYEAALLATKYERTKALPNISATSELYKCFKQLVGSDLDKKPGDPIPSTSKRM